MEVFATGQDQPKEELPLKIGKVETIDGDETGNKKTPGDSTTGGSGLGRPDLIQWVHKMLMPGRNVRFVVPPILVINKSRELIIPTGPDMLRFTKHHV